RLARRRRAVRLAERVRDQALAAEPADRGIETLGRGAGVLEVRQELAAQPLAIGLVVDPGRRDDAVDERAGVAIVTHARPRGWPAWRRAGCPTAGVSIARAGAPSRSARSTCASVLRRFRATSPAAGRSAPSGGAPDRSCPPSTGRCRHSGARPPAGFR